MELVKNHGGHLVYQPCLSLLKSVEKQQLEIKQAQLGENKQTQNMVKKIYRRREHAYVHK